MSDLTSLLNDLLSKHNARLKHSPRKRSDIRDEFLKEAYRINDHILSLQTYLLSIRQAYLSTSPPPRRQHAHPPTSTRLPNVSSTHPQQDSTYLTNPDRDAIDASSKTLLRDLNASIRQLSEAESIRRTSQFKVLESRYSKGLLGRWAAGGGAGEKSPEQVVEESRLELFGMHRDSVLWFLGRKLEEVGEVQRGMMERRLEREVERGRSVLYKIKGPSGAREMGGMNGFTGDAGQGAGGSGGSGYKGGGEAAMDDEDRRQIEQQLSPEQLQLFARENQDMLKHYEDTLDQVRTAERSMIEISELQTTLVQNLDIQSANISQLVAESLSTTENVGGGNKELKRATERKSTARMVFWASCGLCGFLVTWDLIF
ncbi:hypothetical protein OEA41_008162 [Lepraria neglecta]|uniref:SNARE-complex protein Syntaxin-18 N-terminal domain-containing protein n=1 Tax=Lepraria neglecta TaxID=209136 RepID=A0AAD9ZEM3_9LECA|nr:hypothetical protein OEA41_008162 [Lepraria neglecta]